MPDPQPLLSTDEADTLANAINTQLGSVVVSDSDMQAWANAQSQSGSPSDLSKLKLLAARIRALGG